MSDNQHQAARIKFRLRRGMLELDTLLNNFYDRHYVTLNQQQKILFEQLLEETDADLFRWLIGMEETDQNDFKQLIGLIQQQH